MKFLFAATLLLISVFVNGDNEFLKLVGIPFDGMSEVEIKQNAQDIIKIMEEEKKSEMLALETGKISMLEDFEIPTEATLIDDITRGQKSMEESLKKATSLLQAANFEGAEERENAVFDVYHMFEPLLGEDPITEELWNYIDEPLQWEDLSPEIKEEIEKTIKNELKRPREEESEDIEDVNSMRVYKK